MSFHGKTLETLKGEGSLRSQSFETKVWSIIVMKFPKGEGVKNKNFLYEGTGYFQGQLIL